MSDVLAVSRILRLPQDQSCDDTLAVETPVALVYNGLSHAVMMASPQDLEHFALGFTLSEGIAADAAEVYDIEVKPACQGLEVRVELSARRFAELKARRRQLAGRTGCGLCGVEQLDALFQPLPALALTQRFSRGVFEPALSALHGAQPMARACGATHAAAWVGAGGALEACFEDVGRHVALDKLLGWRARAGVLAGFVLVTSRASYEMVDKCVRCGVELLAAVSAPTSLAVELATRHGLTLAGFVRPGRANVYSHPERLL